MSTNRRPLPRDGSCSVWAYIARKAQLKPKMCQNGTLTNERFLHSPAKRNKLELRASRERAKILGFCYNFQWFYRLVDLCAETNAWNRHCVKIVWLPMISVRTPAKDNMELRAPKARERKIWRYWQHIFLQNDMILCFNGLVCRKCIWMEGFVRAS